MSFTLTHEEYLHVLGGPASPSNGGVDAATPPNAAAAVASKMAEGRAIAQQLGLDPDVFGLNEETLKKIGMSPGPTSQPIAPPATITPAQRSDQSLPRLTAEQLDQTPTLRFPTTQHQPNILDNLQALAQNFHDRPLDVLTSIPRGIWSDITGGLDAIGGLAIGLQDSAALHDHMRSLALRLKDNPNDTETRNLLASFTDQAKKADAENRAYGMNLGKAALLFVPMVRPFRLAAAGLEATGAVSAADAITTELAKKSVAGIGMRLADRVIPGAGIGGAYGYFSSNGDWEKSAQGAVTMGAIFGAGPIFSNAAGAALTAAGKSVGTIPAILETLPGATTVKRAFLEGPVGRIWDRGFAGAQSIMRRTGVQKLADEMDLYRRESAMLAGSLDARLEDYVRGIPADDHGAIVSLIQRRTTPANILAKYGEDAGRPIIRAAAGLDRDWRNVGSLAKAWGIPVYNPAADEYYNFVLKDGFFPHILPNPEKYATDEVLRKSSIDAIGRNLKMGEAQATKWLDDWIERAKVGNDSEARSGIVSEPTLDARLVDLPGYSLDLPNVGKLYNSKMARTIAAHRRFGRWRSDLAAPLPNDAAAAEAVGQPLVLEPNGAPRLSGPTPTAPRPGDLYAAGETVGIQTPEGFKSGTIKSITPGGGATFGPSYEVAVGKTVHNVRETDIMSFRPGTAIPETAAERRTRLGVSGPAPVTAAVAKGPVVAAPQPVYKPTGLPGGPAKAVPMPGAGQTLLGTIFKTVAHVVPPEEVHDVAVKVADAVTKGKLDDAVLADGRLAGVTDELHAITGQDLLTGGLPYMKRSQLSFMGFGEAPPAGAQFPVVKRGAAEELFPSVFKAIKDANASAVHQEIMNKAAKEMLGYQLSQTPFEQAVTKASEKIIFPIETVTKLSLGAISQLSQVLTGVVRTQYRGSFENFIKAMADDPEAVRFAMQAGTIGGQAIREAQAVIAGTGNETQKFLKWTFFSQMDNKARIFGAIQGAAHAQFQAQELYDLWRGGGNASKMAAIESRLVRLGIDPRDIVAQRGMLSEDQRLLAGQSVAYDVNFWGDALSLPRFFRSPVGRVITQFKSFSFQQTQMVRDHVLMPWIKYGDYGPALRFATLIPLGGEAIADLKNFLRGRDRTDKVGQRVIENIAYGGGFGLAFDAMQQASRGMQGTASLVQGPAITDGESLASGLLQVFEGKPRLAAEMAVRMAPGLVASGGGLPIPLVAGAAALAPGAAELLFPAGAKTATGQQEQREQKGQ